MTASMMLGLTATTQAATPGQVCQVNRYSSGWTIMPSGSSFYRVYFPSWVRIVGYNGNTYIARANGQANGALLREAVNQSTCRF